MFHEKEARRIRDFFRRLDNMAMTENNLAQAYFPEGSIIFENSIGTAPGCAFDSGGKHVIMLPGPPGECKAMLRSEPFLSEKLSDSEILSHNINIFGLGESAVEDMLRPLMISLENPPWHPMQKPAR